MVARATFGAGCFWGVEHAFRQVPGVVSTAVGYMGGMVADPTYERVCRGDTGHAEVCDVRYDPARVSYEELLDAFWAMHDPTQGDRQGPDVGRQYRSVIFTHTPEQEHAAHASRDARAASSPRPITTSIEAAGAFTRAEEYHQRYHDKHGGVC